METFETFTEIGGYTKRQLILARWQYSPNDEDGANASLIGGEAAQERNRGE